MESGGSIRRWCAARERRQSVGSGSGCVLDELVPAPTPLDGAGCRPTGGLGFPLLLEGIAAVVRESLANRFDCLVAVGRAHPLEPTYRGGRCADNAAWLIKPLRI